MRSRKGFTLIELMVVVLIVAVLAALLVPLMTSRIEAARWSEGKAGAGTIATALRAYIAEQGEEGVTIPTTIPINTFMSPAELTGKYFQSADYGVGGAVTGVSYNPGEVSPGAYQLTYTIRVNQGSVKGSAITWQKTGYTLDYTGAWAEL